MNIIVQLQTELDWYTLWRIVPFWRLKSGILSGEFWYILLDCLQIYKVYMIDGLCRTIYSLPFRDICNLLLAGGFSTLRPVTKNQIINTDHIRTISKADNGRIEITLINLPEKKFYVGNKHQKSFDIFL